MSFGLYHSAIYLYIVDNAIQGGGSMEIYIGIGFIILCLSILVFMVGFFGYIIRVTGKELDVHPAKEKTSSSNNEDRA